MKTTEAGTLRLKLNDAATFGFGTIQENISEAFRVQQSGFPVMDTPTETK